MAVPRIYADFHNADSQGRLRLVCTGTALDLAKQQVQLAPGVRVLLYADDSDDQQRPDELEVAGVVEYSAEERCWVARIDWSGVRHASQSRSPQVPGLDLPHDVNVPDAEHT
jgi:hypothetical protein